MKPVGRLVLPPLSPAAAASLALPGLCSVAAASRLHSDIMCGFQYPYETGQTIKDICFCIATDADMQQLALYHAIQEVREKIAVIHGHALHCVWCYVHLHQGMPDATAQLLKSH
jgi:hypothetical protein